MNRILVIAGLAALAGCAEPTHLGYDFGASYTETFTRQADLTRPSVANRQYVLYGLEAVKIRLLVEAATTETKEAQVE